jgi:hypothetical protein
MKTLISIILFVPTVLLASPYLIFIYPFNHSGKYYEHWSVKPFIWVHLNLMCGGDKSKQIL